MELRQEIRSRRLIFDGGTGSLLQENGLKAGEFPEIWNITHPEVCKRIHLDYLEAGADLITSNTFGANGLKFKGEPWAGISERPAASYTVEEIVAAAMENARAAVKEAGKGRVALDLGPTGKLLAPLGDLPFERAVSLYRQVVAAGKKGGADLVLIETMSDSYELKAAVLAAKEEAPELPVFATVIFDEKGKLLTGGDVESVTALLEGLKVDALGINCGLGPAQMKAIVRQLLEVTSLPVIVNPNAGLPRSENGRTFYDIDAAAFAAEMEEMAQMGVSVLGGCCGTTPEHIRRIAPVAMAAPVPAAGGDGIARVCSMRTALPLQQALDGYETLAWDEIDTIDAEAALVDLRGASPEDVDEMIDELLTLVKEPVLFRADDEAVLAAALRRYPGVAGVDAPFAPGYGALKI